jgi:hypothetical protein
MNCLHRHKPIMPQPPGTRRCSTDP